MALNTSYVAEREHIHTSAICIMFIFFILRKFSNYNGVFGCSNIKSVYKTIFFPVLSKKHIEYKFEAPVYICNAGSPPPPPNYEVCTIY